MYNSSTLRGISVPGMRSAAAPGSRTAWYGQIGPYRDAEIARLSSFAGSSHRRRRAQYCGLLALGVISVCSYLELTDAGAQQALISWISFDHADAVRQSLRTGRSTLMAIVEKD